MFVCKAPSVITILPLLIISTNTGWSESYAQIDAPVFEKRTLLNGMDFLFLPTSESHMSFLLMVRNGAAFDPFGKWGVTYLTTRLLMEETESRTGRHIQEDLEKMDADLDFRVDWDAIFFFGSCSIDQVGEVLNLLAEMVVRPQFREETFERLRSQVLHEVKSEQKGLHTITQNIFLSELLRGNPYEHPVKGNSETLQNLYLTDLKVQYRKLFMPNQAHLALYYSGETESMFNTLSRRWGSWVKSDPAPFTFRPARRPEQGRIILFDLPNGESLFRWGSLGVKTGDRDYHVLKVFEQYLTLSLPAWTKGVAPTNQIRASSVLEAGRMPGYLQLSIQAPSEELLAYFQKFQEFAKNLLKGEIDPARFEEAKRLAYLEITTSLEEPHLRLFRLLETTLYSLGINFITHYGLRLSRITPDDFVRVLPNYLSLDQFVMAVAGPVDKLKAELDKIGQVIVLP